MSVVILHAPKIRVTSIVAAFAAANFDRAICRPSAPGAGIAVEPNAIGEGDAYVEVSADGSRKLLLAVSTG